MLIGIMELILTPLEHPAVLPAEESLDWAPPPTDDFKHPAPSALPPTLPSNPPKDGHIFEKGGKEKKFPPKDDDDGEKSTSTNPPTSDAPAPTYARRDYTPVGTKRPPPLPSNPPKNPKDGKAPGFRPKQADDSSKAPSPAKDAPAPIHARRDDDYPVKPKDPIDNGYSPHE